MTDDELWEQVWDGALASVARLLGDDVERPVDELAARRRPVEDEGEGDDG